MHEPLTILWHDAHAIAVYKPAGWLVHRTGLDAGETRFVVQTLRDQIGQHVYPVHRLDKGTCGVLLLALHSAAARQLSMAFAGHAVRKRYLALVRGWAPDTAEVDHPLRPDDAPPDAPAQSAHTRVQCLALFDWPEAADPRFPSTRVSLAEAWPTTGRRHQVRRHLKHIAHPIIGDATYGKGRHNRLFQERFGCRRMLLACTALRLTHPVTGQPFTLAAPLADDFASVIAALGWPGNF